MPKPYTIRYGQWTPDLQSVGVEMPYQWSDTEIAVADCLNVYWQDGAYRCLPAMASFGPSLGAQALDCFTWYDNTQGKEVVFAATANGFFTLIDGVWTAIPTLTTLNALGQAITIQQGSFVGLATAMSPSAGYSRTSNTSSYTFSPLSAVIGYGSATGYNWRFGSITGPGSWAITSGQGDSAAVAEVTGSTGGSTSTATCYCDITFNGVVYTVSAPLSYTETVFNPVLHSYTSGSGTETVPSGASNVVIEVKGGGGGFSTTGYTLSFAAGGGGGGYCRTSMTVTPGGTFNYSVGPAGGTNPNNNGTAGQPSTVSSGTIILTTMTANGGGGGNANGAGGSASGGNQANANGSTGVNGGAGGASTAGVHFDTGNTYGHGGAYNSGGETSGCVSFYYT